MRAANEHTVKAFDTAMRELTRMIAALGAHAQQQTIEAVNALVNGDTERGRRVVRADALIDELQRLTEERVIVILATRQPVAADLRQLVGALRIANNLERVGDLAKNIGKRAMLLDGEVIPQATEQSIARVTDIAVQLLDDVLHSYLEQDAEKAVDVWRRDAKLDALVATASREMLAYISERPAAISTGVHLLFCAKNIERIGDHATNIAEAVHYIVKGYAPPGERPKVESTRRLTVRELA